MHFWCNTVRMTLAEYLERTNTGQGEFAKKIGSKQWTVSRYLDGRTPSKRVMEKIWKVTGGLVQPNDFYSAPKKGKAIVAQDVYDQVGPDAVLGWSKGVEFGERSITGPDGSVAVIQKILRLAGQDGHGFEYLKRVGGRWHRLFILAEPKNYEGVVFDRKRMSVCGYCSENGEWIHVSKMPKDSD